MENAPEFEETRRWVRKLIKGIPEPIYFEDLTDIIASAICKEYVKKP